VSLWQGGRVDPTYVEFSRSPAVTGNAVVQVERGSARGGRVELDAAGSVRIEFTVPPKEDVEQATLAVTGLVSKFGPRIGFAPLDIMLNERSVVAGWTIPGGGDLPTASVFAVPGDFLRPGANVLRLASAADARSRLWLYRVTLDPVWERGRSERALAEDNAGEPVLRYDTRLQSMDETGWRPGPQVHVYIDRGEQSLPAQLSWQDARGIDYAVVFTGELDGFYGHCREPGGEPHEFRGQLSGRWADPAALSTVTPRRFDTWEGWGGGWHRSNGITLLIGTADSPARAMSWRDQRGNSAAIALAPKSDRFLGTYQRVGEGAIGYRGHPHTGTD